MTLTDRAILEFCAKDFRRLKDLRAVFPGGTLYRRAKRLIKIGWLERQGPLYRTTNAGRRNLLENQEGRWDQLEQFYPPLALIPTEVHRALVELIFAAVMVRQHPTRGDRHPFFVCSGDTLHWKTSLGEFVCLVGKRETRAGIRCAKPQRALGVCGIKEGDEAPCRDEPQQ